MIAPTIDFVEAEVLDAKTSDLIVLAVAVQVATREVGEKYGYDEGALPPELYDYVTRLSEVAGLYVEHKSK